VIDAPNERDAQIPRNFSLHRDNRYVLRAGLLGEFEAALGTLHVLAVGDDEGESGHSVDRWNAEMLKSERRTCRL